MCQMCDEADAYLAQLEAKAKQGVKATPAARTPATPDTVDRRAEIAKAGVSR